MKKTIEDMHKTFCDFNDRAIASGIQKGAPPLAKHLKSTAERLSELAKNSTEESDVEEDDNDPGRSIQPVATEPRRGRQERELGPEPVSMLGYQTTFDEEEEEEEEEEDAGEIAAPPAQLALDNNLPLPDWIGTETMQQLRSEGPKSNTRGLRNMRPVQQHWVDVQDSNIEQFLRSKGLYLDGQYSVPYEPIDSSLGSDETSLPLPDSPYCSPSLNSSGGPHTPESTDTHWPNEAFSSGNQMFWNATTDLSKGSDMDLNDSLDDRSIRLLRP